VRFNVKPWTIGCFVALCAFGSLSSGCGGSKPADGPGSVASAGQRLQGDWRVKTFVPESALEAPLQGLLSAQLGAMTVNFVGDQYHASGPGMDIHGRYELKTAGNDLFDGIVYDASNVGYRVTGQFQGRALEFRSYDSAWRGSGTLERP